MARETTVFKRCKCPDQDKCRHVWTFRYTKPGGGRSHGRVPDDRNTRAKAQAWLDSQNEDGIAPAVAKAPVRKTFRAHAEEWLEEHCTAGSTSKDRYRRSLENYVYPVWGSRRLDSISHAEVSKWARELEREGKHPYPFERFRGVMIDAHRAGLTQGDVFVRITPPANPSIPRTYVFDDFDYQRFLEKMTDRYLPIPVISHDTGTRRGETLGLCLEDIDWDSGWITVQRQVINDAETDYRSLVVNRLKTSRRRGGVWIKHVPMSDAVRQKLLNHIRAFPPLPVETVPWDWTGRPLAERPTRRAHLLFYTRENTPINPRYLGDVVQRISRELKLFDDAGRLVSFHAFRHTFVSMALQEGVPPSTVALWVGDSLSQLEKTYMHLIRDLSSQAYVRLRARLARSVEPSGLAAVG